MNTYAITLENILNDLFFFKPYGDIDFYIDWDDHLDEDDVLNEMRKKMREDTRYIKF